MWWQFEAYNNASWNQECQNIDVHEVRRPSRGLMFTDTSNNWYVLACIGSVQVQWKYEVKIKNFHKLMQNQKSQYKN